MEDECVSNVVVWFEDDEEGRAALALAHDVAEQWQAQLTVVTVATHEPVRGCGRCLQGTVLWNLEMKKIAKEELRTAMRILDGAEDVEFRTAVGDPADVIAEAAERVEAQIVVLPWQRPRRLGPPCRRHVAERVGERGHWQVRLGPPRAPRHHHVLDAGLSLRAGSDREI